jgi:hypothetical protein
VYGPPRGGSDGEIVRILGGKEIEIRYTRAYRLAVAAAADVMRQRALQADARNRSCKRCGASLDRIRLSGMALNVECGYCLAVNTIEPGQALRAFAVVGAMALAERQALELWEAMTRALTQINQYRERKDVPLELLREYERGAWLLDGASDSRGRFRSRATPVRDAKDRELHQERGQDSPPVLAVAPARRRVERGRQSGRASFAREYKAVPRAVVLVSA